MVSARIYYEVSFCKASQREDLPEIGKASVECQEALESALALVRKDPCGGEPKSGVLTGAFSVSFFDGIDSEKDRGRVVYAVEGRSITVWAAHPSHEEAYRRARERYRKRLR